MFPGDCVRQQKQERLLCIEMCKDNPKPAFENIKYPNFEHRGPSPKSPRHGTGQELRAHPSDWEGDPLVTWRPPRSLMLQTQQGRHLPYLLASAPGLRVLFLFSNSQASKLWLKLFNKKAIMEFFGVILQAYSCIPEMRSEMVTFGFDLI